jgi:hypothetical protein
MTTGQVQFCAAFEVDVSGSIGNTLAEELSFTLHGIRANSSFALHER